jgi:hydrogenase maturation factor
MARVDDGSGIRDIYIQLVEAVAGDTVLVHADVAIGKLVPQA